MNEEVDQYEQTEKILELYVNRIDLKHQKTSQEEFLKALRQTLDKKRDRQNDSLIWKMNL